MDQAAIDAFLADLTALTHKHEIAILGCGCCSSPFLGDTNADEINYQYVYDDGTRRGTRSEVDWKRVEPQGGQH